MREKLIILLATAVILCGCREEDNKTAPVEAPEKPPVVQTKPTDCQGCHPSISLGAHESLTCVTCHRGRNDTGEIEKAHEGLVKQPAHPDSMEMVCGPCHQQTIQAAHTSPHFTLKNTVNLVRTHFGARTTLDDLTKIPVTEVPEDTLGLADDMLRRRCLRCHVYSRGDGYAYTRRGTGCAACHVAYSGQEMISHEMLSRPADRQCLSCHYANHVGGDYYGRFEHDFNWEYRTPYTTTEPFVRPYGVEQHDLAPDIHQQAGMTCLDCHSGSELMNLNQETTLTCRSCHEYRPDENITDLGNLSFKDGSLVLTTLKDGTRLDVPQMRHPAHNEFGSQVACQVCHGQWSFNDFTTHLLRSDLDDYDEWERLTVQSSSEVEQILEHNLYSDEDELDPSMHDGITGIPKYGLWYKGFTQRRWEEPVIDRDRDGVIRVFRPILDLRLSWIRDEDDVRFDNVQGKESGLLPYTPHTTGKAGLFYRNRFRHLLDPNPATESSR